MKKKILFVYDMKVNTPWGDGLWAALNLLDQDFEIKRLNVQNYIDMQHGSSNLFGSAYLFPFQDYDFVLGWGAFNSRVDQLLHYWQKEHKVKSGLCIAGTTNPPDKLAFEYNIVFYETEWQKENQLAGLPHARYAFGVNTDIFNQHSYQNYQKIWDYIGVGAISTWKRWEKIVDKRGMKLVVGHYQVDNEAESAEYCRWLVASNVMVSNEVTPEMLAKLYHSSRICFMPSNLPGGGERTVWEARSCGLTVEVVEDNPKLQSLLTIPVLDHHSYAQELKKGIESVI